MIQSYFPEDATVNGCVCLTKGMLQVTNFLFYMLIDVFHEAGPTCGFVCMTMIGLYKGSSQIVIDFTSDAFKIGCFPRKDTDETTFEGFAPSREFISIINVL